MRSSSQILNALLYLFFIDCLLVEVTHQNGVKKISAAAEGWSDISDETVAVDRRIDCLPDGVSMSFCAQRGCIQDTNTERNPFNAPKCYFPTRTGYSIATKTAKETTLIKKTGVKNPFGTDISPITFSTDAIKTTLNIRIGSSGRLKPPVQLYRDGYDTGERFIVEQLNQSDIFAFKVKRQSTNAVVWDTSIGGLFFADQFIQIAAFVGSSEIYGIGENIQHTLRQNVQDYHTWGIPARDNQPYPSSDGLGPYRRKNLFGMQPFYMAFERDYKAHGVLIFNANPQDITIGPAPHLIYRTIGGMLDIYFFPGPTPEDVIRQYTALVGRPALPAYWELGFQMSNSGWQNLTAMQNIVNDFNRLNIPLDVVYADIETMNGYEDFIIGYGWQNLTDYSDELHSQSKRMLLVLDPSIPVTGTVFRSAFEAKAKFVEWERPDEVPAHIQDLYPLVKNTKIMLGVARPNQHVAYLDFWSPLTIDWWKKQIASFLNKVHFDGIMLEDNTPSSYGTNRINPSYFDDPQHSKIAPLMCPLKGNDSHYDMPPYQTYSVYYYKSRSEEAWLSSRTLCMLASTEKGRMYDVRSVYGLQQSIATRKALHEITSKRSSVLTGSTFPSSGHYAGHWLGDNSADFADLRSSVINIQAFNMFGIPFVGADICGFYHPATLNLCARWHQLGAFYSLSRVHKQQLANPQYNEYWMNVADAMRIASSFRYRYLPYLYTLHFEASRSGGTVVRPLFFEFPNDDAAHEVDRQFMWGHAFLVAPILKVYAEEVYAYVPREAIWYYMSGQQYAERAPIGFSSFTSQLPDLIPVFIRGGSIVPRQQAGLTTTVSRKNPFELLVALDENLQAKGNLLWDDGESIVENFKIHNYIELEFSIKSGLTTTLTIKRLSKGVIADVPKLTTIEIFGYDELIDYSSVRKNGNVMKIDFKKSVYDKSRKRLLLVADAFYDFTTDKDVTVTWKSYPITEYVPPQSRVDCAPGQDWPDGTACEQLGCLYDGRVRDNIPKCYFPKRSGYIATKTKADQVFLKPFDGVKNPFGDNISPIEFSTSTIDGTTTRIRIGTTGRFEPPLSIPRKSFSTGEKFVVETSDKTGVFSFSVKRSSTNHSIWDTSIGGLMFGDQYIQIAAYLGSSLIYGIGENIQYKLRHNLASYMTWAMLARDQPPNSQYPYLENFNHRNLYGVYPFYIAIEADHKAHGVLILNSNPQEITLGPSPHLIYRTIGGMLDVYFFPGPSPKDVIRQYLALVGYPALPAYWALGYQISRYGYHNLTELSEVVDSIRKADIPLDVVYADIDYMNRYQDFTIGKGWENFPSYIDKLHTDYSMHAILIFDPAVQADGDPFQRGLKARASFIEWDRSDQVPKAIQDLYPLAKDTKIMLGVVWPDKHVAFPDFSDNRTIQWWKNEIKRFHDQISFDGIWIDMNEPANFGTNEEHPWYFDSPDHPKLAPLMCPLKGVDSKYEVPPYQTYNVFLYLKPSYLSSKTVCMSGQTKAGRVYDVKNLYGLQESIATESALHLATSKRGAVITRSSYPSAGHYAGHWLGDNSATWYDLITSVIGIQEFNIFGLPYIGADICGFLGNTTEELCLRWQQLGAFYPFSRNHNDKAALPQHPTMWPSVQEATREANLFRYEYLPYLYLLHFEASRSGGTVIRPIFFEFPNDDAAYESDREFMWGSALLIIPVVLPHAVNVYGYLPHEAVWYHMTGDMRCMRVNSGFQFFDAPPSQMIPVFIKGGSIIPRQAANMTTTASRKNPLELLIALDENGKANGRLIWDDGESVIEDFSTHIFVELEISFALDIETSLATLTIQRISKAKMSNVPNITVIEIFGYEAVPMLSTIRKQSKALIVNLDESYFDERMKQMLITANSFYNFNSDTAVTITWKNHPLADLMPKQSRIECMPQTQPLPDMTSCEAKNCIFDRDAGEGIPTCYYPRISGYKIKQKDPSAVILEKYGTIETPYGKSLKEISFSTSYLKESTLNVRIGAPGRFEPPLHFPKESFITNETFTVKTSNETGIFSFKVIRVSNNRTIWDTSIGGMMFADQFIQIGAFIGSSQIYGIGENQQWRLRHNIIQYTTWPMMARDQPPGSERSRSLIKRNLYGVYPFYLAVENDYKAHGVLIVNSNPQEITLGPAPHFVYRTIGGMLDIYFFPGPSPQDVIRQYLALVGHPTVPAYWALGFQISRYGYKSLSEVKAVVNDMRKAGIPLDVVYADIDYMDRYQDFTIGKGWEGLPEYVDKLSSESMHTILIFDPAVQVDGEPFKRGLDQGASFVEWETQAQVPKDIQDQYPLAKKTKIMLGVVWPDKHVAFPDFSSPATIAWWKSEFKKFHQRVKFDGIWIDMNEPANFGTDETHPWYFDSADHPKLKPLMCPLNGTQSKYDMPPYETYNVYVWRTDQQKSYLSSKTLCMLGTTTTGRMYDTKNLYGLQESIATQSALHESTSKRGAVITRSSFPSGGRYAGHWLGDNSATWFDLRTSVVGIQLFNMFGIPYIGADICGFLGNTTAHLCLRWQQLGAFYPFSRNHNDKAALPQHPTVFSEVAKATKQAMLFRYRYLPYLYTLHFEASRNGSTVVRPLFFEFPNDDAAHEINRQFMWGSAMLIVPVVKENATTVYAYLPHDARWFSMLDSHAGEKFQCGFQFLSAPLTDLIPVFIRGGSIVPRQPPALTAMESRKNPLEILIAVDQKGLANGQLIWDDGESIINDFMTHIYIDVRFSFIIADDKTTLVIERITGTATQGIPNISVVEIFGYDALPVLLTIKKEPGKIVVDESETKFDQTKQRLQIKANAFFDFATDKKVTITWASHRWSSFVPQNARVDCMPAPTPQPTELRCYNYGCIFDGTANGGVPKCYFPRKSGYTSKDGSTLTSYKPVHNPYGVNVSPIFISQESFQQTTLHLFIGPDTGYVPPIQISGQSVPTGEWFVVESSNETGVFSFKIIRPSTNAVIWDTSLGGMMFSEQFIQIAARIPTSDVYGLGENVQQQLKHDMSTYTTWPMFARDEPPDSQPHPTDPNDRFKKNLYGVYPFYMAFEKDNKAHGVLILNANAQEMVLGPAPHIVYRTIGGALDLYFFPGPSPEDVVRQYLALIGTPALPAYWALGFQLSRYGYKNLQELSTVVNEVRSAHIPLDVAYADIDYMNRYQDFTIGKGWEKFPEYVKQLHDESMHAILIFDPAIQADGAVIERGLTAKANFVEWERADQVQRQIQDLYPLMKATKIMLGVVWPDKHVAFPDFSSPETMRWWSDEISRFHKQIAFDGIWIDMNEPANFGTNEKHPWYFDNPDHPNLAPLMCPLNGSDSKYDNPPYQTYSVYKYRLWGQDAYLSSKTLCMLGATKIGKIYDMKNMYGLLESIATQKALHQLMSKRSVVITRSSFPSGGRYAGHWLGDNYAAWNDLRTSVVGIQLFNIFGIPYIGADICGFGGNTTEELCLRWQQLGAFYTFMRNHNSINSSPQQPSVWPTVANAARQANLFRYRYLPYLYSLHFEASVSGGTVIRPTFFEFPNNLKTHENNEQFMWGSALLIAPVLREKQTKVSAYLPEEATWYWLRDEEYGNKAANGFVELSAPLNQLIPVFIRGGSIVARQKPEMTTVSSRKNPFDFLIALDSNWRSPASGVLFWDDGESLLTTNVYSKWQLHFTVFLNYALLTITPQQFGVINNLPTLDTIEIFGYPFESDFKSMILNGVPLGDSVKVNYDSAKQLLRIEGKNLINLSNNEQIVLMWSNSKSDITVKSRVDCMPAPSPIATPENCGALGCIFDGTPNQINEPKCYFPKKSGYMKESTSSTTKQDVTILRKYESVENPYGPDISPINFSYSSIGQSTLNVRIGPSGRFEPPIIIPRAHVNTGESFVVEQSDQFGVFSFKVTRKSTGTMIWDTSIGGMLFADQYIQIAAFIGSSEIYGIGENTQQRLKHNLTIYSTWPMFARDQNPEAYYDPSTQFNAKNLYGAYPFYLALENDNKAHGVLIINSNPQEITLGPAPHIVYRTIGGMLDIYFFPGPSPEDVVKQYLALVGTPALPSYWSLGYQLGRDGYMFASKMMNLINDVRKAAIPIDVLFAGYNYMKGKNNFELAWEWYDLIQYAQQLHNESMHLMIVLDAGMAADGQSFRRGRYQNASFIEWENESEVPTIESSYPFTKGTKIMLGVGRPDANVAFPDFFALSTDIWWISELQRFHDELDFDGVWLDMNEPTSYGTNELNPWYFNDPSHAKTVPLQCPSSKYDKPPYQTYSVYDYIHTNANSSLASKTLCMAAISRAGPMYDVKNLYGLRQSYVTQVALQNVTHKRANVLTRSSFPSGGKYAGHWLGENSATWYDMRTSIVSVQLFNMFGIPYVGADICGYHGNATEDLCARWQQLGAFYTLSRNHNDEISSPHETSTPQYPTVWSKVSNVTRQANLFKYQHLPYLYTLMFEASRIGGTVIRPLFFEFSNDKTTHDISNQFMWGSAMLIVPVSSADQSEIQAYLPPSAMWYSMRGNIDYAQKISGGSVLLSAPQDDLIPVFIRGGSIVPRQRPRSTTIKSRKSALELLIALDEKQEARGQLVWDDGESIINGYDTYCYDDLRMFFKHRAIQFSRVKNCTSLTVPSITTIEVFGYTSPCPDVTSLRKQPGNIPLDNAAVIYDQQKQRLLITATNIYVFATEENIIVEWGNGTEPFITTTTEPTPSGEKTTEPTSGEPGTTETTTKPSKVAVSNHPILLLLILNALAHAI